MIRSKLREVNVVNKTPQFALNIPHKNIHTFVIKSDALTLNLFLLTQVSILPHTLPTDSSAFLHMITLTSLYW